MDHDNQHGKLPRLAIAMGVLILLGLVAFSFSGRQARYVSALLSGRNPITDPTATLTINPEQLPDDTAKITETASFKAPAESTSLPRPTQLSPPTATPSPSPSPTPTLDLAQCNAAGCDLAASPRPTVEYDSALRLASEPHVRRVCDECPQNHDFSDAELNTLLQADEATLARLQTIALSQETFQIAPGIVYIVYDNVHHVVIDLKEPGHTLRNIIPTGDDRETLITPSYCQSANSLVVIDADYHGLNGSNKTETGRDLFFHLGRAALFERNGRFDIDVIRKRAAYDRTSISFGGGPIFLWNGEYNYNPEQEWFDEDALEYYRDTRWAKVSAALSKDRKYMFLTVSYGLTLEEHAQNIIELGQKWGLVVDRAMRFDGGESAYLAIRLGNFMVPVLNFEEPLIANCLAVERSE